MLQKKCAKCNVFKPINNFYKHFWNKDKRSGSCKNCDKEKVIARYRTKTGLITHIYSNQKIDSIARGHNPPAYTKQVLSDWFFEQGNFILLYNNWVDSNYSKRLTPSVDRLNDNLGYSLDNIQLITWRENNIKGINKSKVKVNKFGLDGAFIKTYNSITLAKLKTGAGSISECCRGKVSKSGNFLWKYA